jgi:hypothetical protein
LIQEGYLISGGLPVSQAVVVWLCGAQKKREGFLNQTSATVAERFINCQRIDEFSHSIFTDSLDMSQLQLAGQWSCWLETF